MAEMMDRIGVNGVPSEVTLTVEGRISWKDSAGIEKCLVIEKEVLGFKDEGGGGMWRIRVCALVIGEKEREKKRIRKDFVLKFEGEDVMRVWLRKLRDHLDSLGRPKRLIVFLNPFGGKKKGQKIFNDKVKPLLDAASISYTLKETRHKLHGQELAHSMNLFDYDGVLCISGDGLLVEVINGLLQRKDWVSAIKMPLGIVPAGTGNGMIKSLLDSVGESCTVYNAVFMVIRGHKRKLDVATISQGHTLFFSVLMLCWGLIADIDIESEKLRWMGSMRLNIYSLIRAIKLRKYNGVISFIPARGYESYGEPTQLGSTSNSIPKSGEEIGYRGPTISSQNNCEWRSIKGPFISIWLHNVRWASTDTLAAPDAKFSDGCYDLIVIKDGSRYDLLTAMGGMSDGSYVKLQHVLYLKVTAFRLEPGNQVEEPENGGIIDSDGEVLTRGKGTYLYGKQDDIMDYSSIEMQVDEGLATIFSP